MPRHPRLDHAVINVRNDMDSAEAAFAGLGFQLTPRGYHTLGSINHLMMFATDYLELIGLPATPAATTDTTAPPRRADIANAPFGLNGLVFKCTDVDATFAHLQAVGMAGAPPKSFSRPVTLTDGTTHDARFRTVTVRDDVFPAGRVYFCEHLTPDLVWRPEWQRHANGATAIRDFVMVATDAVGEASRLALLLGFEAEAVNGGAAVVLDGAAIRILSPAAYAERYGELASRLTGRPSMFGALVIETDALDAVRSLAVASGQPFADQPAGVVLKVPAFDTVLEFRAR